MNKSLLLLGQSFLIIGLLIWSNFLFSPNTNRIEKTWINEVKTNLEQSYNLLENDTKYQIYSMENRIRNRPDDASILNDVKAIYKERNAILDTIFILSAQKRREKTQNWQQQQFHYLKKTRKYNKTITQEEVAILRLKINSIFRGNHSYSDFDKSILKHQFLLANKMYGNYLDSKIGRRSIGGSFYGNDCAVTTQQQAYVGKTATLELFLSGFCQKSTTIHKLLMVKINGESVPLKYGEKAAIEKNIKTLKDLTFDVEMQVERKHYAWQKLKIDTLTLQQSYNF